MSRQRQAAGAGSINLQAGRDLSVSVNLVAAPAEDDESDVHVRVHIAFLTSDPRKPVCWFVNVINRSRVYDITVTHVWFETVPRTHVLTRKPGRVAPSSQWETWIEAHELPFSLTKYEWLARIQLADDRVIESVPRENVPEVGFVPGEAIITFPSSRTAPSGSDVSSYAASASVALTGIMATTGVAGSSGRTSVGGSDRSPPPPDTSEARR